MRGNHAFACLVALASCATEAELHTTTSEINTCVPFVGHWRFWGECANDVPLAVGSEVRSLSSGQVVAVLGSCGGFAGRSVRIDHGDGRYMYSHVDAAVSVGQWLEPGSLVGWVFGGAGPVYCNASLTTCGVGWSASRQTLCWSGPHLHREGECCAGGDCNSGFDVVGAIRDWWTSLGGCASWLGSPITNEYQYDGTPWGMAGWVAESEFEGGWLSYEFATGAIVEWPR